MENSFQKSFTDSEFIEIVQFTSKPKYGWSIHPIVLEVEHEEFGHVQIKTEIHELDTQLLFQILSMMSHRSHTRFYCTF